MNNTIKITVAALTVLILVPGCMETQQEKEGAATGALIGAGAGAIAGNNIKGVSTAEGAIAGAVIGGLLGQSSGKKQAQIDAQQEQLDAMQAQQNRIVIHITNSNGSTTPVVLHRTGVDQWQGPKGEIYNGLPSKAQLKPVYGF